MSPLPEHVAAIAHADETAAATARYLEALTTLGAADVRAPSALPGWSRGHVISHVARNADGLRNLFIWARTGVETPQYASSEQRNLDIDSGARRSLPELIEDFRVSADRFLDEASRLHPEAWDFPVRTLSSPKLFPARDVFKSRRIEVEVHHADLGVAYTAHHWPEDFTDLVIGRVQDDRADGPSMVLSSTDTPGLWKFGRGQGPEISGSKADLAWWLIGRGDGSALVSSAGVIPELGRWR